MKIEDRIIDVVISECNITLSDFQSKARMRPLVEARRMVTGLLRKNTNMSLKEIGMKMGNRDHSSISYLEDSFNDLMFSNREFRDKLVGIIDLIKSV